MDGESPLMTNLFGARSFLVRLKLGTLLHTASVVESRLKCRLQQKDIEFSTATGYSQANPSPTSLKIQFDIKMVISSKRQIPIPALNELRASKNANLKLGDYMREMYRWKPWDLKSRTARRTFHS